MFKFDMEAFLAGGPSPRDELQPSQESEVGESGSKSPGDSRKKSSATPERGGFEQQPPGNIGSFTDADIPLIYCARRLASKFLLCPSRKGALVSDR